MSFFYAGLAGAGLWALTSHGYNMQQQLQQPLENASQKTSEKEPFQGAWEDVSKQFGSTGMLRQRFVSVTEDTDVLGATIYIVDYGSGARTVQYQDPRELL
jgi:hypothetical protein